LSLARSAVVNCFDKRTLPEKVPTGFIRRVWRPLVLRKGAVDRQAYEICMLCELRDRLRAGDVWVEGSRDYRDQRFSMRMSRALSCLGR
jgi:hypothetical protein